MQDELRPEYDLRTLQVRKVGLERKHSGRSVVQLAPDVAEVFQSGWTKLFSLYKKDTGRGETMFSGLGLTGKPILWSTLGSRS